ncbi:hypothetical protein FFLO_06989 [Filobasidium floriforme]|uniref:Uncharacterized protein n=1 Tax=Filobasidium floriforme TaxID=5210 RepID=A0A8K0JJH7_9TREE|nr:hypothetical protein FFLO_06989 [Filobasidium floriforme]
MSSPSTSISEEEIMKSSETAQALYHNHLIMSEVYRYLDRSDLSQCLLVTKTGYHTAAKAFFHTSSHESFTKMTAKGCSFDRLADLARMVRVLTLPWLAIIHRNPGQYQIHHGEILSQFPSLDVVQLCGLGSGRLHTVEEKHEIDGRELLVQFPAYYLTCLFSIPPSKSLFLVPGSTKWSSRALSFSPQSRAHCQDELVKQALGHQLPRLEYYPMPLPQTSNIICPDRKIVRSRITTIEDAIL